MLRCSCADRVAGPASGGFAAWPSPERSRAVTRNPQRSAHPQAARSRGDQAPAHQINSRPAAAASGRLQSRSPQPARSPPQAQHDRPPTTSPPAKRSRPAGLSAPGQGAGAAAAASPQAAPQPLFKRKQQAPAPSVSRSTHAAPSGQHSTNPADPPGAGLASSRAAPAWQRRQPAPAGQPQVTCAASASNAPMQLLHMWLNSL